MTALADTGEVQTYTAHVPAWEIDANDHWNTAYYVRAFQNAAARFALAEAGRAIPAPPQVLHVRFFRELRLLETFRIGSLRLSAARAPYTVAHLMRHGTTGALAACALEFPGVGAAPDGFDAEPYAPRSLLPGRHDVVAADPLLQEGLATVSHAGILQPEDYDATGALLMTAIHARVSDGNGHLWLHYGVPPDAFYGRGLGRAIVELKITKHADCPAGTPVRQVSSFRTVGAKSVEILHQLEDLRTGVALSSVSTVTLIIDLERRKSTALPPDLAEALSGRKPEGVATGA